MYKRSMITLVLFMLAFTLSVADAQDLALKHCAVELTPLNGQFDPSNPRLSSVVREDCFESFAEAVAFATRGRINLPPNTPDLDVLEAVQSDMATIKTREGQSDITPQTTYTLAYMYDWSNYQTNGGTLVVSSSSLCSSSMFYAYNLTSFQNQGNWANRIESWKQAAGSGCNTGYFYASPNLGGAWTACGNPCAGLGTLNNDSESFVLVP